MARKTTKRKSGAFGHFTEDSREYVITDPLAPPRAQINFLWNDALISGVNQFGSGEGIFNDRTLTLNHPKGRVNLIRHGHRLFYLRDTRSGAVWNAGLAPTRVEGAKYQCRVGLSTSTFEMAYAGIESRMRIFLAHDEPVEIWEFTLTNTGRKPRSLWLVPYVEWDLGGYATFSSRYSYLRSTFDPKLRAVLSWNTSNERPHGRYSAFVATDRSVCGWAGSPRLFFGPYGDPARPDALRKGKMPDAEAWCEDLAGALAIPFQLAPGKSATGVVLIGSHGTSEEAARLIAKTSDKAYRAECVARLEKQKTGMIEAVTVETPDEQLNRLTNIWAKQQIQLCVEFGRDGARGFRDTLQDAWATAPFNPKLAREKIIETLRHQHADGHAIRGWLPIQPQHYSDGPVWIAMATTAYLKETGDLALLDERVPYLDGGDGTVREHMLRGVRFLSDDTGAHGLVLAHEGDWNDSLNWLCLEGKGESVWTSLGLYHALDLVAELAAAVLKDEELAADCRLRKARIGEAIEKHAWDGNWYLAGYNDLGEPVGSHANREGRIYLNSQTWAVLTGIAQGERKAKCLKAIDEMLESTHGSLTLAPTYTVEQPHVGRLSVLLPGMYENGTPYCHGTAFKIVSDCTAGRGDQAFGRHGSIVNPS
jgi:cellobiose phosphorylase